MTNILNLALLSAAAIMTSPDINEGITYIDFNSFSMIVENDIIEEIEIEYEIYNNSTSYYSVITLDSSEYNIQINNPDSYFNLYVNVTNEDNIKLELSLTNAEEQVMQTNIIENSSNGFEFNNYDHLLEYTFTMNTNQLYYIYAEGESQGFIDGTNYGYNQGYNEGEQSGYNDGYQIGYNDGYQIGLEDNEEPFSVFRFLERITATIANILNVEIFPNITIGTIIFIPIILKVVEFIVGWFR